jgi:hypothetical protein
VSRRRRTRKARYRRRNTAGETYSSISRGRDGWYVHKEKWIGPFEYKDQAKQYRRKNPIDDRTLLLVGVGVVGALALGYAIWANPAEGAEPQTWPTSQFAQSPNNVAVSPGQYVLLLDAGTNQTLIAEVQSIAGQTGTGIVVYAPTAAPESRGDTVNFLLSSVVQSSALAAELIPSA